MKKTVEGVSCLCSSVEWIDLCSCIVRKLYRQNCFWELRDKNICCPCRNLTILWNLRLGWMSPLWWMKTFSRSPFRKFKYRTSWLVITRNRFEFES